MRGRLQTMTLNNKINDVIDNIVSSYEIGIQELENLFNNTCQVFISFQDLCIDTKDEREEINDQLRNTLAKNISLRKKDFDNIMNDILLSQDGKENEVRALLKNYLNEQREMAGTLRKNLGMFKDSLAQGEADRVKEFHILFNKIFDRQDERRREVISKLHNFQEEQRFLALNLKELLTKGKELRIKDLRLMLRKFRIQHIERLTYQAERGKEVSNLLFKFKQERVKRAQERQMSNK
jgi:hypothetical protein